MLTPNPDRTSGQQILRPQRIAIWSKECSAGERAADFGLQRLIIQKAYNTFATTYYPACGRCRASLTIHAHHVGQETADPFRRIGHVPIIKRGIARRRLQIGTLRQFAST